MKSNKFFKFIGSAVLSLSMAISGAICTNFLNKNNSPTRVEASDSSYVWTFSEIFNSNEDTKKFYPFDY